MPAPSLPLDLSADRLAVVPWDDPVVESVGHDLRSPYVERFWLPLLGPSTTLLLRRIAAELEARPEGFDLPLRETARSLGLGTKGGTTAAFFRAIGRTTQFHIARPAGTATLAVRRRVQHLTRHQLERLPAALAEEHARWMEQQPANPDVAERRQRARQLALSLLELGETAEAVEHQLHRWRFHPAMAHEALRWALERHAPVMTAADRGPSRPRTPDAPVAGVGPRPVPPPPRRSRPAFDPTGDAA